MSYVSGRWVLQCCADVDWTPCDRDDRCFYYAFDYRFVHDVPTGVVETGKRYNNGKVITGQELQLHQVLLVVLAKRRGMFDEAKVLKWAERDEHEEGVPLPDTVKEDLLAFNIDAEYN